MSEDPIIEMSPAQKRLRVEKLRAELHTLGFSVVPSDWLKSIFWEAKLEMNRRPPHEETYHPRSNRSQGRSPQACIPEVS